MKASASKKSFPRWLLALVLIIVALPVGYYVARHHAWPAYKVWREAKLTRMTQDFIAAGDFDNALLTARQALRNNQRNVAHWRLAATAAKAKGSPESIYYQQNVARFEPTLANQLELLRLEIQYGDYRDAVDTIEGIDPGAKRDPEFHRLAANVYQRVGRPLAAKLHLYSLVSLQPTNQSARLDLAEMELAEDSAGKNEKLRQDIRALAQVPELRLRALTTLLEDALARQLDAEAVALAKELQATPTLSGTDRVMVLAGLSRGDPATAETYRRQLQADLATDPRGTVALVAYYRKAGLQMEARRWFDSLPRETRQDVAVQEAIATTFLEWKDWVRLDQALNGAQWKQREFMREAFLAYSARQNSRLAEAGNAWRLAVIQGGDNVRNTSELLALVTRWGWQTEQYDLVWKLFALMPRNESISRQLLAWERFQGHTANINRIFARLAEFSGDDRMVKNNLAYSSLLLEANLPKAIEMARENFRADPKDPFFVTTYAFALYRQNKAAEALATLETLRPAALSVPERAMFRALYRVSTGDATGAATLLAGVKSGSFLPEERRLAARAVKEIARLNGEKGEDARLYALNNRGEIDRSKGWLHALPEAARTSATMEMQTADSLLALGDVPGLANQLRRGSWGELEHIRLALTGYVSRKRNDDSSARFYWRTALANAGGDVKKLGQLQTLSTQWNWPAERAEVLARLFDIDPSNQQMFAELMEHYRAAGRTPELVAVLSSYLSAYPQDQTRLCDFAYYSMLSGVNVARAYVTAQEIYRAAPSEPDRRLVYAFALWKQRRAPEAFEVLEQQQDEASAVVPVALLRAAVLADMDRRGDAAAVLKRFDATRALPEEAKLAATVATKLKNDARVSQAD